MHSLFDHLSSSSLVLVHHLHQARPCRYTRVVSHCLLFALILFLYCLYQQNKWQQQNIQHQILDQTRQHLSPAAPRFLHEGALNCGYY